MTVKGKGGASSTAHGKSASPAPLTCASTSNSSDLHSDWISIPITGNSAVRRQFGLHMRSKSLYARRWLSLTHMSNQTLVCIRKPTEEGKQFHDTRTIYNCFRVQRASPFARLASLVYSERHFVGSRSIPRELSELEMFCVFTAVCFQIQTAVLFA